MQKFEFSAIGVVRCDAKYRFEAPRQGVFSGNSCVIELLPEYGGDAIADLAGFERIWVIFCFHLNLGHPWKARVKPPFPANGICRSLFATRSPYRVNPVGLSCVKVEKIERRRIYVSGCDILDGTPVLDIKPYIPEADSFPGSAAGWRDETAGGIYQIVPESDFLQQAGFIRQGSALDLLHFCEVQLCSEPLDFSRKRITPLADGVYALGCRTWRIIFSCDEKTCIVKLHRVESNYRADELLSGTADRYVDKDLHRRFTARFGS